MLSPGNTPKPSAEIAIAKQVETQSVKPRKDDDMPVTDRITKQCRALSETFGLSKRETEVMELIARGWTGASISEKLFISENTTRTHTRRIYAKLGVHK
jgi:DNA-binding CsgD family transcriptional regulator